MPLMRHGPSFSVPLGDDEVSVEKPKQRGLHGRERTGHNSQAMIGQTP